MVLFHRNDSESLDEPMDINLVRRPANDITTAECRKTMLLLIKQF